LSDLAEIEPVFANIEITTRCNLSCAHCARSFVKTPGEDMPLERFRQVLSLLPHAYRVTLVGLGEPLLHPRIADLVAEAASRGRRVGLVTNAMLLDRDQARALLAAGLHSIAFSIDAPDQELASEIRPGTDLERVIGNIRSFLEVMKETRPISTAVFTAVSTKTVPRLEELMDVIAGLGVHVLMMSDLNFEENQAKTLWKNADAGTAGMVRKAVARAFSKKLPVLSVHGLEEFGLSARYDKFLLIPPDSLYQRSTKRRWCCSPWQTVPVNVRGDVTVCDCQPEAVAGNILSEPFSDIWNGEAMKRYRRQMQSPDPPKKCLLCPRF
jgi:radical SAM protein with 4Fe4S-binding SPASM domain